ARRLCLLELRGTRLLPDDQARRLLRDAVGHLRAELLERRLRRVARERLERAGDHVLPAGERAFARPVALVCDKCEAERPQLFDQPPVVVVAEPLGDPLGALWADP